MLITISVGIVCLAACVLLDYVTSPTYKRFKDEEVPSSVGYPAGWKLKSLSEQVKILKRHFPLLDVSHAEELAMAYQHNGALVLPDGMDGLVVIPKYMAVAKEVGSADWPAYNRAMALLISVIKKTRTDFVLYADGLGPNNERLSKSARRFYEAQKDVPGDVLVIPVQTGLFHRGRSFRRARALFAPNEFDLDAFAIGCVILTHPERLRNADALWIDCAGTETQDLGKILSMFGMGFSNTSGWGFENNELRYVSYKLRVDFAHPGFGPGSTVLF
ncbi:MAG: hypothetical protein NTX72_02030 [Candidatus Uhrbacteria bacterium]|nr:hypothetical protein [Candidatus Uhrbacteria bacterium]